MSRYEIEQPESHGRREGPYEYPALEPDQGYWAGRWVEFKRLFSLFWNDGHTKPVVITSSVIFFGMTLWGMAMTLWEMLFG